MRSPSLVGSPFTSFRTASRSVVADPLLLTRSGTRRSGDEMSQTEPTPPSSAVAFRLRRRSENGRGLGSRRRWPGWWTNARAAVELATVGGDDAAARAATTQATADIMRGRMAFLPIGSDNAAFHVRRRLGRPSSRCREVSERELWKAVVGCSVFGRNVSTYFGTYLARDRWYDISTSASRAARDRGKE